MVVVVLPTPPFWLHMEITRAWVGPVTGEGSGNCGIGRPVGPSGISTAPGSTSSTTPSTCSSTPASSATAGSTATASGGTLVRANGTGALVGVGTSSATGGAGT